MNTNKIITLLLRVQFNRLESCNNAVIVIPAAGNSYGMATNIEYLRPC